jgi:hypothetical protein
MIARDGPKRLQPGIRKVQGVGERFTFRANSTTEMRALFCRSSINLRSVLSKSLLMDTFIAKNTTENEIKGKKTSASLSQW